MTITYTPRIDLDEVRALAARDGNTFDAYTMRRVLAEVEIAALRLELLTRAFEQGDPAAIEKYKRAQEQGDVA